MLSDGKHVPFVLFAGAQFLIDESPQSAWYFDLGVIGGITIQQVQDRYVTYAQPLDGVPYTPRTFGTVGGGGGVGFGFCYEHISGLSVVAPPLEIRLAQAPKRADERNQCNENET